MPRYRFGIFEFDSAGGSLRRHGAPVRIQAQPAQVLAVLLEHAGAVVSREQLREAVWGEGTFVDFDQGLNFCVAQVRSALGDSADSPVFIRTAPRRGYEFIAPVERSGEAAVNSQAPARATAVRVLALCAAGVALVCAGFVLRGRAAPEVSASAPRVAIVRFDNQTSDEGMTAFAEAITDSITAELAMAGAGRFDVIGNAAILRRPRGFRDLQEVGRALDAGFVVLGQVQPSVAGVRVLAHLIRLPDQAHLTVARFEAARPELARRQAEWAREIAATFGPYVSREESRVSRTR